MATTGIWRVLARKIQPAANLRRGPRGPSGVIVRLLAAALTASSRKAVVPSYGQLDREYWHPYDAREALKCCCDLSDRAAKGYFHAKRHKFWLLGTPRGQGLPSGHHKQPDNPE